MEEEIVAYQDWSGSLWVKWPMRDGRVARIRASEIASMVPDRVDATYTLVQRSDDAQLVVKRSIEQCERDLDLTPYFP